MFRKLLLILALLAIPIFGMVFWHSPNIPKTTLNTTLKPFDEAGKKALENIQTLPALAFTEDNDNFLLSDSKKSGMKITFANRKDENTLSENQNDPEEDKIQLSFPKKDGEPLTVQLSKDKTIAITSRNARGGEWSLLTTDNLQLTTGNGGAGDQELGIRNKELGIGEQELGIKNKELGMGAGTDAGAGAGTGENEKRYLLYSSEEGRRRDLYSYNTDGASGEKYLKHWVLYQHGLGKEIESYHFENAKLKRNEDGSVGVFFVSKSQIDTEKAKTEADPKLLERAQNFLKEELGEDALEGKPQSTTPDIVIPAPFFYDKTGKKITAIWTVSEDGKTLSVDISAKPEDYPLALDPTLGFTAPGVTNSGSVIGGEGVGNEFGFSLAVGDINADGKTDIVVGATRYGSSSGGYVYVFYGGSIVTKNASGADAKITREVSDPEFGYSLAIGDFNVDGKVDLAVGSYGWGTDTGRAYIFYNGSITTENASGADVIISGEGTNNRFGYSLTTGDLNADGKTDLVVGAISWNNNDTGRTYIFYNGSITTKNASAADVIITGEGTSNWFGSLLVVGDLNADGKTDLTVTALQWSSWTGRVYVFYNGSITTENASGADVIISGSSDQTGQSLTVGDFNVDGKTDLAVGAFLWTTYTGRVYIFYNGSIVTKSVNSADVIITGEGTNNYFGLSLTTGDFNVDGKTDLAVGATQWDGSAGGKVYIFYNGSITTKNASGADIIITGEGTNHAFGYSLAIGDLNGDGKTDLVVGAYRWNSNYTGRAYVFYSQNGQVNTNTIMTGEGTNNNFGISLATGDLNADGKTDLAVGASGWTTNTGRTYIFYNGSITTKNASGADIIITGEGTGNAFGSFLATGDLNADGKADLAVGANQWNSGAGRAYVFYNGSIITENASGADVIISGSSGEVFSSSISVGDLNADGKVDLIISGYYYSSSVGRVYIFYNGSITTENASGADIIITGEGTGSDFGNSLATGDLNADGKTDLAVGAYQWNSNQTGRAYIFYNGSITTENASGADVIITGEGTSNNFGWSLATGDLNADGKVDLAVGATAWTTYTGRTYIFYNGSITTENASGADVIITGEGTYSYFGTSIVTGDLNADGKTDLIAGISNSGSSLGLTGRIYIFFNDGSFPAVSNLADSIITGEVTYNYFGASLATGDLNADGKTDLAVGGYRWNNDYTGRVYLYETRDNFSWKPVPVATPTSSGEFRTGISGATGQEMKIHGEVGSGEYFGFAMTTGDLNADGKTDLVVGAYAYSTSTGRAYIFYNDGSMTTTANSADVVLTGELSSFYRFGASLATGDLNADGKTDLVVGAYLWNSGSYGRVYIFYNGSITTENASGANVIITGEGADSLFGSSLATGDLNADGKTDLAVGASGWDSTYSPTGRAYIFYNGSIITENASGADIIITGEGASNAFGSSLTAGDLNADGKTDLAVGAYQWTTNTGRVYIFYNGSIITENASGADVIITGEGTGSDFGTSLATGDLNSDGKTDLAVGAPAYYRVRAYIFYNGSITTENANGADVIITGEGYDQQFGASFAIGDLNADGKTDLAVGAYIYSTNTGRAYIFYNGSITTKNASAADIIITGEGTNNAFGHSLVTGDFNSDGKIDLVVGASGKRSNDGAVYLYTMGDSTITGEGTNNDFGWSLATGDLNADGKTDLVVGADRWNNNYTGRAYIFYNGSITTENASGADVIITGEGTNNNFGTSLATGDLNADGKIDLVVGANKWNNDSIGRAYIFYNGSITTENASGADVIITGEGGAYSEFAWSLATGDLNADGKTDLAVGAYYTTGRAYIFYNGSITTENASGADIIITGEGSWNFFGYSLVTGDLNADGKIDLVVGANSWNNDGTGRAYIFYNGSITTENASGADVIITGEGTNQLFSESLATGDLNADGKTDLVVGAKWWGTYTGRVYIFYNGSITTENASGADVIITGEASWYGYYGINLTTGDFNDDGKTDLVCRFAPEGNVILFFYSPIVSKKTNEANGIIYGEGGSNRIGRALATGDMNSDGRVDLIAGDYLWTTNTGRTYIIYTEAYATEIGSRTRLKGATKLKGAVKFR